MLIKLTPAQVVENWSALHYCIAISLPPVAEYSDLAMTEVKKKLLEDKMQCWVVLGQNNKIQTVITTTQVSDVGTGVSNLLIYSFFSLIPITEINWEEDLQVLKRFAVKLGCKKILSYSNVPSLINLVKSLGGKTDFQLLSMEVK